MMDNSNKENHSGFMVPRADFKGEQFDTLILQKGYKLIWQQGMYCSCYEPVSGQPSYNCLSCKGKGYVYFGDTETRGLVSSISGRKEQEHIGLQELGSAYLTPLSTDDVGFRDRFTFLDFTMKYSEIIEYYGDNSPLTYTAINIIAVRKLEEIYRRGIDFNLSKDGKSLEWITSRMDIGSKFSILYTTRPVYIATNPIHELRGSYTMAKNRGLEKFVVLPKQYQIKREDFIESGRVY